MVEPRSERDLALHRYLSGAARSISANALLDLVITLEAILLPYDEYARHGDLSYRFRMHGAHYLACDSEDRTNVFRQLDNLYSLRSRLVHGGKYPDQAEVDLARTTASRLATVGLLRAVNTSFPTAAEFRCILLE